MDVTRKLAGRKSNREAKESGDRDGSILALARTFPPCYCGHPGMPVSCEHSLLLQKPAKSKVLPGSDERQDVPNQAPAHAGSESVKNEARQA